MIRLVCRLPVYSESVTSGVHDAMMQGSCVGADLQTTRGLRQVTVSRLSYKHT